jgi:hypothetical protein
VATLLTGPIVGVCLLNSTVATALSAASTVLAVALEILGDE